MRGHGKAEWRGGPPRTARALAADTLLGASRGKERPATRVYGVWSPGRENVNVCCSKPPVWGTVTAAPQNQSLVVLFRCPHGQWLTGHESLWTRGGGGRAPSPSPRDGWPTRLRWSACALCAAEESVSAAGQGLDTGAPRWTHRGPGDRRLPDVGAPSAGNRAGAQGPLAWAAFQEPRRGLLCRAWTLFLGLRDLWQVFKCAAEPGSDDFPAGTLGAAQ